MKLGEIEHYDLETPGLELLAHPVGAHRHHHGSTDHDRVGTEGQRFLLGQHQGIGHHGKQRCRGLGVEGRRRDHRAALVEGQKGKIHVVHPRVDDPVTPDPHLEVEGEVLEGELLGARAVADHEAIAPGKGVSGLEVRADTVPAHV